MAVRSLMTQKHLIARDGKRYIGVELLLSVRQLKTGKGKVVACVEIEPALKSSPFASQSHNAPL